MSIKQSFCWQCGKKLDRRSYRIITDPIGNDHIVHITCVDDAMLDMRAMPYEEESGNAMALKSATMNYK